MSFTQINIIAIALIAVVAFLAIYFIFKKDLEPVQEIDRDVFSIPYLSEGIKLLFDEITNQNIAELYLNKTETQKRINQKARLNKALRTCAQGNIGEKEYVKDYIKDLLQSHLKINEDTINRVIPFHNTEQLTVQDKFEMLLLQYKVQYRNRAFEVLSEKCGFEIEKENEYGIHYEGTEEDVQKAFHECARPLSYIEKLEIVTQRIYQERYGFSVADEIRDMRIDGCSGGISGVTTEQYNYMEEILMADGCTKAMTCDSFWVYMHGKPVHLSFLSFGSMNELIRVCKNLYRYDNVGHLTSTNGQKLTYLQDGSRVVVARPKITSEWSFFLRKYDSTKNMGIDALLTDIGSEYVVSLSKWLVKGLTNIIISGDQNSGKTTFLKALMGFIDQRFPIRTVEQEFELWLNNIYPHLNLKSFRPTEENSIVDVINLLKKTDAAIIILGEVASAELANAYIELKKSGTKMVLCTCHCVTTQDLVEYFRNATLSKCGSFTNEMIAEEEVAGAVDIDIHWVRTPEGHRYISHITEVIPLPKVEDWPVGYKDSILEALKRMAKRRAYLTRDIIVYENGRYIFKNPLSPELIEKITRNLNRKDKEGFEEFIRGITEAVHGYPND